jgi:DNA-binding NtrC family response regulator
LERNVERNILVIDDDENARHFLNLELSDMGYEVVLASNAFSGLNILKEKNINLVILDIKMPGMDGIEALEKIMCFKRDLPVIIHSAYSHFKENYLTWGATDYVLKSSNMKTLSETIERYFNLGR